MLLFLLMVRTFLVLYYLRNKKTGKKILYSFLYAILFIIVMLLIYLIYAKDITMFFIMTMQQDKYRESILTIILDHILPRLSIIFSNDSVFHKKHLAKRQKYKPFGML